MRTILLTFGSHGKFVEAGKRLIQQAKRLNIFTDTILYTSEDLQNDAEFWNTHRNFITKNPRGYGYWLWKSYIIKKTMEKTNDGDIILYLDCGCELGASKKEQLRTCMNIVKTDKIVGTTTYVEREWTKMDLVENLEMNKEEYLTTAQRQAGAILFSVCEETRLLVDTWYDVGCEYHNIDDSPSILQNVHGFREHRHDQSIFSLLTKKYELFSTVDLNKAIYYIRNKTGQSKISRSIPLRLYPRRP